MKNTDNPLNKLITTSKLYKRYSGILSLSDIALFLLDNDGKILYEFIPSPDFCNHICNNNNNDACAGYKTKIKEGMAGAFTCQNGLENILIPIKFNEETLGYIGGIQSYLKENEYKKHTININKLQSKTELDLEFIAKSITSLKVLQEDKIELHKQLCAHIGGNIALDIKELISNSSPQLERLSIEKEILERKIIDLEAKNMSLVVNPHFLFNTLNCIARIAYFEKSSTTEELIYALSDLLRYNLKNNDQLHTIASEIDNIEKYLFIQKERFKNRLNYEINISEEILASRIPNMIIQPIVENAILHGISKSRDGGKINIYGNKNHNLITIFISDNGRGFSEEALANIKTDDNLGLGLKSTDNRLKKYYGDKFGLDIIKSDHTGSTIAIKISTLPLRSVKNEKSINR